MQSLRESGMTRKYELHDIIGFCGEVTEDDRIFLASFGIFQDGITVKDLVAFGVGSHSQTFDGWTVDFSLSEDGKLTITAHTPPQGLPSRAFLFAGFAEDGVFRISPAPESKKFNSSGLTFSLPEEPAGGGKWEGD